MSISTSTFPTTQPAQASPLQLPPVLPQGLIALLPATINPNECANKNPNNCPEKSSLKGRAMELNGKIKEIQTLTYKIASNSKDHAQHKKFRLLWTVGGILLGVITLACWTKLVALNTLLFTHQIENFGYNLTSWLALGFATPTFAVLSLVGMGVGLTGCDTPKSIEYLQEEKDKKIEALKIYITDYNTDINGLFQDMETRIQITANEIDRRKQVGLQAIPLNESVIVRGLTTLDGYKKALTQTQAYLQSLAQLG